MDSSRWEGLFAGVHPARRKELEEIRSSPEYIEGMQRLQRVSVRPRLAFAFVEDPLADNLLAVVYLSQHSQPSRYAVVSRSGFDDQAYQGALGAAFDYEMRHEDDSSPVTIKVYRDGSITATSEKYGPNAYRGTQESRLTDRKRGSARVLARLEQARVQEIAGLGPVRLVTLD